MVPTASAPARLCRVSPTATSSLPATVPDYLASTKLDPVNTSDGTFTATKAEVKDRINKLLAINGNRSPDSFP